MSKEGSQVAFIPDNISNISSGKERCNEDASQKLQDSYISKLTKIQNNIIDPQSGLQFNEIKNPTSGKLQLANNLSHNELVAAIVQKIAAANPQATYQIMNMQKSNQKNFLIHKPIKQPSESFNNSTGQLKRYQIYQTDNTYLQGRHTQTDVISEKESFVEEEQENYINKNIKKSKIDENFVDIVKQSQKHYKKKPMFQQEEYPIQQGDNFYITQVDRYDEFDTQFGLLERCVLGNSKYLLRQTSSLLNYNQAVMMQIEKVQLRTKIIELEIQTNKLKILLRKSQSAKHINFSVDLKFNRPTILKIPKKIDSNLRTYCSQLQKSVAQLKNTYEINQKELTLLEFYQKQFEKKVNYAYIYQEYLIQKAKKELDTNFNLTTNNNKLKSSSTNKNFQSKKPFSKLNFQKSPQKNVQKVILTGNSSHGTLEKVSKQVLSQIDQSITSLADRLRNKNNLGSPNKLLFTKTSSIKKVEQIFGSKSPINKSSQQFIRSGTNEYYTETLNKTSLHNKNINNESSPKRISLTHHKQLSQPSNKKYVELQNKQGDKSYLPLFNTANRSKKHFYYQCQAYLKQLQHDYLFACQSQKQNILLTNQNGFRQRQLLKMKTLQVKNLILDAQVDFIAKQKDIKKQNSILKKQLQLLENQLFTKFNHQKEFQNNQNMKKSIKSPHKIHNLLSDDYNLLYKQAQRRLKSFKSATMLESISKPNIPKSPKKIQSHKILQKSEYSNKNKFLKQNKSQQSDTRTLKKDPKYQQRLLSKSPKPYLKMKKSVSKSSKFLNRFKTTFSQAQLNITMKDKIQSKQTKTNVNPQKTTVTQRVNRNDMTTPQTQFVDEEYYAI